MNSIRIRVVKTEGEIPFHTQVSMDNLLWWTVASYKDLDICLAESKDLEAKFRTNWKQPQPTHVLWKTTV